ncbi:RNA-binding riboflavin kinase RibR [Trichinella spiralis]|uniref:RNA-binding riboflavin kinase RibR n=1 Tax=Trichinella spiralis TaxID=6334 RepID=A0ABR3KCC0_TRISP
MELKFVTLSVTQMNSKFALPLFFRQLVDVESLLLIIQLQANKWSEKKTSARAHNTFNWTVVCFIKRCGNVFKEKGVNLAIADD